MEKLDEAKGQKEELKVGEFENLSNSSSPKTKEEIWKKEVPIPPFYFQPTLVDMLVPIKALHYKDYPYFADMPEEIRERIVALLPIDLPLDLISDKRVIGREDHFLDGVMLILLVMETHGNSYILNVI